MKCSYRCVTRCTVLCRRLKKMYTNKWCMSSYKWMHHQNLSETKRISTIPIKCSTSSDKEWRPYEVRFPYSIKSFCTVHSWPIMCTNRGNQFRLISTFTMSISRVPYGASKCSFNIIKLALYYITLGRRLVALPWKLGALGPGPTIPLTYWLYA